jgi:hypothetical protein
MRWLILRQRACRIDLPLFYTANRFLPLARLRLMTRRPAFVDILFLNPWVRARLILLGW